MFPKKSLKLTYILILGFFVLDGCKQDNSVSDILKIKKQKLFESRLNTSELNASLTPSVGFIKGVNNPFIWWPNQAWNAVPMINHDGFNAIRIVWNTTGTADSLSQVIDQVQNNNMLAIVELHDITGDTSVIDLNNIVNYWTNTLETVMQNHPAAWLNIANEWGNESEWETAYINAIKAIRKAGITNTLVIDAPEYGQDDSPILSDGNSVMNSDPLGKVVFSIHMYGSWNSNNKIYDDLQSLYDNGIPVIIGEFGYDYNNGNNNLSCSVDAPYVMQVATSYTMGYLAWSWGGNNSENAWLDLTNDWNGLSSWGQTAANGPLPGNLPTYDFENGTDGWTGEGINGGP